MELPPDIGGNRRPGTGGINQLRISAESSRRSSLRLLTERVETRILLVKPFGTEYSAKRDSLTNECISENPVLVNTMEKIDPAEFSIQEFGSVSRLEPNSKRVKCGSPPG